MKVSSAEDSVAFFEPDMASRRGALVVRHVLDQARRVPQHDPGTVALSEDERSAMAIQHRLQPLVLKGWPPPDHRERLQHLAVSQMRLYAAAREVVSWLTEADIECRVLKGLATGPLDYPESILRQSGDVDLIVGLENFLAAEAVLVHAGCSHPEAARLPGLLMQGSTLIHPNGVELDLHYRIDRYFPSPDSALLMSDPERAGEGLPAFPPELRLVHAAHHALASPPENRRLSSMADIVAILDNTGVDWDRTREIADRLGMTGTVAEALRMEAMIMGREAHPGLDWPRPRWLEARALLSNGRRMPFRHFLALNSLPPGQSKLSYVRRWLLPSREYLDARGGIASYFRDLLRGLAD